MGKSSNDVCPFDTTRTQTDGEYSQNMNTRVPSEPILLLTIQFEKLSIH